MGKTMRAILARRLKFTDELLANVRQRFEGSDEPLSTMAADLGCCKTTLRGIAKREGWLRFVPPPRDLTPAAKLLAQAEKLAVSPFVPAKAGTQDHTEEPCHPAPGFPLARERTEIEEPPVPTPEPPAETVEELHALVRQELAAFKTQRAQLKGQPLGLLERERAARTLAGLTRTLHIVQAMRCGAPLSESHNDNAYDDMPADLDEFRNELARQIDALLAEPPDEGDCAAAADNAAAPTQA